MSATGPTTTRAHAVALSAVWVVALAQAAIGFGVLAGVPALVDRWPFAGTTPLTFTFLASFLLAAAASSMWCVLSSEPAGLVGVGIDYVAILVPLVVYLLLVDVSDRGAMILAVAPTLAFGCWMVGYFVRFQADPAPMPRVVRAAFAVFTVVLLVVAVALFAGATVLPWPVTTEVGVVVGLMFVGAASYFVVGLLAGTWTHAGGQLAGFLAYDLVLVGPLAARVPDVGEEFAVSLALYLAVVVSSGVLAGTYLLRGSPHQTAVPTDG